MGVGGGGTELIDDEVTELKAVKNILVPSEGRRGVTIVMGQSLQWAATTSSLSPFFFFIKKPIFDGWLCLLPRRIYSESVCRKEQIVDN